MMFYTFSIIYFGHMSALPEDMRRKRQGLDARDERELLQARKRAFLAVTSE